LGAKQVTIGCQLLLCGRLTGHLAIWGQVEPKSETAYRHSKNSRNPFDPFSNKESQPVDPELHLSCRPRAPTRRRRSSTLVTELQPVGEVRSGRRVGGRSGGRTIPARSCSPGHDEEPMLSFSSVASSCPSVVPARVMQPLPRSQVRTVPPRNYSCQQEHLSQHSCLPPLENSFIRFLSPPYIKWITD
jgi:hypothetical protein